MTRLSHAIDARDGAVLDIATAQADKSANPEILVSFRKVRKTYEGEVLVVKDLNLDIRRGEFLTMLGPSGLGKTTSLMMLAGFEVPTQGGTSLRNTPPHKRDIGVVFQNYALFPHMTVEENIAFPLLVRRLPRNEQRTLVQRALEVVKLGALGNRRPGQLSGGQQQRFALARALVFEPNSCASTCRSRSSISTKASASPWSMSPTTKPRR